MATPDVGIDVATHLNGKASLVLGTDLFNGHVRIAGAGIPVEAVFVLSQPGPDPTPEIMNAGTAWYRPRVQVRVRGKPKEFRNAEVKALAVFGALQYSVPTGYLECRSIDSGPFFIGEDEQGCPEFSMNFELIKKG